MKLLAYALCVLLLAGCPPVDNQIEEAIKKIEKPDKKDTPKGKKEVAPVKGKVVKPLNPTPGKLEVKKEVTPPGSDGSGTPGTPEAKKEVNPPGGVGEIAEKLKKGIAGIDTPGPKLAENSGEGTPEESTPDGDGTPGPTESEIKTATEQLFNAVEANDVESLKQAIAGGADTEAKDSEGYTPLQLAVQQEKTEVIKALIAGGANPDTPWKYGHTALTLAAQLKKTESLKALIEAGGVTAGSAGTALNVAANRGPLEALEALLGDAVVLGVIDSKDSKGNTALMVAIDKQILGKQSQTETIEFSRALITAGADVNIRNYAGQTALLLAAKWGNEDVVIELLKADPKPELEVKDTPRGTKALWQFVIKNKPKAVQALVNAGARFNDPQGDYNIRPIDIAKQNKFNEIIKILETALAAQLFNAIDDDDVEAVNEAIEAGADVNARDVDGKTALMSAAEGGHTAIVKALIDKGANIEAVDNEGNTALILAERGGHSATAKVITDALTEKIAIEANNKLQEAIASNNLAAIEEAISEGANLESKDEKHGLTPLMQTTHRGHAGGVAILLEAGADVNAKTKTGYTALMASSWKDSPEIVETLIDKGADVNYQDNDGWTALMRAAYWNKGEIVKTLLGKGADVDAKNNKGVTALMFAAYFGHKAIVQDLLGRGADKDVESDKGQTALLLAVGEGHQGVVEILVTKAERKTATDKLFGFFPSAGLVQVQDVIAEGADVNAKDSEGLAVLFYGINDESKDVVEALVNAGANMEATTPQGETALIYAAKRHTASDIVEYLVEAGANVDAEDSRGMTALAYAERHGDQELIDLLKEKGATK